MYYRHKRSLTVGALALLLLLVMAGSLYAAGESLQRSALLAGGGALTQGSVTLHAAVGQPVAGLVGSGVTVHCAGIRCTTAAAPVAQSFFIYLPTASR